MLNESAEIVELRQTKLCDSIFAIHIESFLLNQSYVILKEDNVSCYELKVSIGGEFNSFYASCYKYPDQAD